MTTNRRITPTESYEPKQRIVGGIVLFLLMLLLYSLLKLLLGLSTVPEDSYRLVAPLPDEIVNTTTEGGAPPMERPARPIPRGFVFLDLSASPAQGNLYSPSGYVDPIPMESSGQWVVQIASFKEESRAQRMIQKLKDKNFDAYIKKMDSWYTVRLMPQEERRLAERQKRQIRNVMHVKPMIKKLN